MKLGRHMPTGSRPLQAAEIAQALGCETIQIFINNPTSWRQPQDTPPLPGRIDLATAFAQAAAERNLSPVVVHAPYLINLASPDEIVFDKSVILLGGTIQRATRFGARHVVFHIGSHRGAGLQIGLQRVVAGLRRILPEIPDGILVLLENDVGAGHEVGYRIEHLATVLDMLPEHDQQLGICLDTAHLWGAGYDLSNAEAVERLITEVDRYIGSRRVPVIHLNDTATTCGGHRDLHARIGEGNIPLEGIHALLNHPALQHAAIILETPIQSLEDKHSHLDWAKEKEHLARVRALGAAKTAPAQPAPPVP